LGQTLVARYHPRRYGHNHAPHFLGVPLSPSPRTSSAAHPEPPPSDAALYVVDDPIFDEHRARGHHPERPERRAAARRALERCVESGLREVTLASRDATDDELARAHTPAYLERLAALSGHHATLATDTYISPSSVAAARRAAGCAVALVDALLKPPAASAPKAGIALIRPPGHHATRDAGMGFCLLNNVATAALSALASGLSRVAVVDFDVHHGNGTQDVLYRDPRALFFSIHQWPLYPGTGSVDEVGEGDGAGYTVNVPLSDHATDSVYEAVFDEIILPILDEYAPELILVSAGYDAHERDPLASMQLTSGAYGMMTSKLQKAAAKSAGGRLGLLLEGGYNLAALEDAVAATLPAAAGVPLPPPAASHLSASAPASTRGGSGPASTRASRMHASLAAKHRSEIDRARQKALRRWTTL